VSDGATDFLEALAFRGGHNTAIVAAGLSLLGAAGGLVGTFTLLRKRSLLADAVGHATLPGIAGAFLLAPLLGLTGRELPLLLAGAVAAAAVALVAIDLLARRRITADAAMAVTLSVFFGVGAVLLSIVQESERGEQAGLRSFLFGSAVGMDRGEATLVAAIAAAALATSLVARRPLATLAFDEEFAGTVGLPIRKLDALLMALVLAVTIAGLQAVGLVLVIAVLVVPPVTARLWAGRVPGMLAVASLVGAATGWIGTAFSTVAPRQPTGAITVLVGGAILVASLLVAPRGLLVASVRRLRDRVRIAADDLLRVAAEGRHAELHIPPAIATLATISLRLRGEATRRDGRLEPTERGWARAAAIQRNRELWSAYLTRHADVARDHVDPSVERIEHVLDPALVAALAREIDARPEATP
jgi:manganese/zinc/iron transport system permease protein